jgi:hypothetical protein
VSIDAKIDDLYRQPLDTFVPSRNALAKTLSGPDATRVRALAKPTIVPWAVNQVYWRARPTYDKAIKSGERLRAAQIASLEGRRGADVREAGEAHRRALADAVKEAERLALSLASGSPEPPGRLTKPLQPAGFEALAGVTPIAREGVTPGVRGFAPSERSIRIQPDRKPSKLDRSKERAAAEAARRHAAALKQAEAELARAEAAEQKAREAWDAAHDELLKARQSLAGLKSTKSEV